MKKVLLVHSSLSFAKCSYAGIEKMITWLGNSLAEDDDYYVKFLTIYDVERSARISPRAHSKELAQKFYGSSIKRLIILFFSVRRQLVSELSKRYDYVVSFGDTSFVILFLLRKFFGYKLLISERGDPSTKGSFFVNLRRKLYKYTDIVVFQTEGARDYFSQRVIKHSFVIANPINLPAVCWDISKSQKKISTVGRIDFFQKRQDLLVQAFSDFLKTYADYTLHIYGSGDDEGKLIKLIQSLDLSKSVFSHGVINTVNESIIDSRMFVLSSDFEGIPNALLEAMALGMPVISTDCSPGGARMLINTGENGILIKRNDQKALSDAMKLLADHQDADLIKMGKKARKDMESYSPEMIIKKWKSVIS